MLGRHCHVETILNRGDNSDLGLREKEELLSATMTMTVLNDATYDTGMCTIH